MKQLFINIFFITSTFLLLQGCAKDSWFNSKQNQSQVVPSTVANYQAILDNIIMDWNSPYLGETASDGHNVTDVIFNTQLSDNEKNAYTWSNSLPYTNVIDWAAASGGTDGSYARIYYANLVLDGMKDVNPSSSDQYNNVEGEAFYYRAQNFYGLSQIFAPPYDSATASSDLGIPLRLESDVTIPSVRSTVKETYDQIISDLHAATNLLPVTPAYVTRPSKPAAYALLARMYLSAGNYKDAESYADSCLSLYNTLVDYNTLDTTIAYPLPIYNKQIIMQCSMNVGSGANTFNALVDTSIYNLFDNNDLRKTISFRKNADGTISFKNGNYYNTVFTGLTTEEMYLIRAECYARTGNTSGAMTDLNTLLQSRYRKGTFKDITASSANDALIKILTERKKELFLTGLRWSDLRRLNKDPRFQVTLTRTVNGQTYTLKPNSYQYTFPIPDDIISASGIQQNPGWN